MKVIGLVGRSCAGKNYVAQIIKEHGHPVIDADEVAARVFIQKEGAIRRAFGTADRADVARIVFNDPIALKKLEDIEYPDIEKRIDDFIAQCDKNESACFVNAAVLHKADIFNRIDILVVVEAPTWVRLLRGMRRDGKSPRALLARFKSQDSFEESWKTKQCYRIKNAPWNRTKRRVTDFLSALWTYAVVQRET